MIFTLAAGDYRLQLDPKRGGAVTMFEWRRQSVLRPACGPTILDVASFPRVPFSKPAGATSPPDPGRAGNSRHERSKAG